LIMISPPPPMRSLNFPAVYGNYAMQQNSIVVINNRRMYTSEDEADDIGNELAMLDEENEPLGYVIAYEEHKLRKISETIHTQAVSNYFPVSEYNENLHNLERLYPNVYRVIVAQLETLYVIKSAGSCMRLSNHYYGTARYVAESASGKYKFVGETSPMILKGLSVEDYIDSGRLFAAKIEKVPIIQYNLELGRLVDRDPESKKNIATQFDFTLMKTTGKNEDVDYVLPFSDDLTLKLPIAVHGYPTRAKNLSTWVEKSYQEDKRPDPNSIDDFFPWNVKTVSIGNIALVEKADAGIFSITCATFPGFSGAACTTIDGKKLVGFVVGSQKGNVYNFCISVHHPVFIAEYCKHVIPDLPASYTNYLRPWIDRHRTTIQRFCPSVLDRFK
jgi:hypothetical protein